MNKLGIFGLLAAATVVLALPANTAKAAVVYQLSGTVVDDPDQLGDFANANISFLLTYPSFILGSLTDQSLDTCSISTAGFSCSVASFFPSIDKGYGIYDQVDFKWTSPNGTGGAQILFASGAFLNVGSNGVTGPGLSADAILTVRADNIDATPIPGALPLFATGGGALGFLGWRRKRKAATPAA